ncbi:hypothetical protein NQ314_010669 [Rhamnusium bicolor]|uniref:Transposase n=1 Tax=Rhamnusium bicolor TaxID=1586634 RepID=A0AAV8XPT4_9CUCU|nr:hypothetical protein NQ314_010669 [Rhamnusium bicolor]
MIYVATATKVDDRTPKDDASLLLECRQVAYEMAKTNNVKVIEKWHDTGFAGIKWLYNFRKRHPRLSLRTSEGCSLSRATSFNRHNVNMFYDKLHDVMMREPAFAYGTRV